MCFPLAESVWASLEKHFWTL